MHSGIPVGALAILLAIVIVPFYLGSVFWAFGDARARRKSGCLVAILVAFLSWPLGLIAWLIFRPEETKTENRRIAYIPCQCGTRIAVEQRMAGTRVACISCGTSVVVPELSQLQRILAEEGHIAR
jgi:hypothetical protein